MIERRCPSPPCADGRRRALCSSRAAPSGRSVSAMRAAPARTARSPGHVARRRRGAARARRAPPSRPCGENSARVCASSAPRRLVSADLHVADGLLPQLADLTRALVPVLGLVDAVERGVGLGEAVDADRGLDAADGGDGRESRRRASTAPADPARAAPAQSRSAAAARRVRRPAADAQRVAQLGTQLGRAPPDR